MYVCVGERMLPSDSVGLFRSIDHLWFIVSVRILRHDETELDEKTEMAV